MSTSRILVGVASAAAVVGLSVGRKLLLSKWEISSNQQTGVICNTCERGYFVKTNEMTLQKSEVANGTRKSEMDLSLYENKELKEKADKYCSEGTFVCVSYKKYYTSPFFAAESPRRVTSIEPVNKVQANMNKKS